MNGVHAGPSGGENIPHRAPPTKNCSGGSGGGAPRVGGAAAAAAGGGLDTLAQPCQSPRKDDRDKLRKRAKAKHMTLPLAVSLAELRSPLETAYRNTIYCAAFLEQQEDGRITTRYCGNRWCILCARVRTARAINGYLPVLSEWQDRWFVTLTIRNVSGAALKGAINDMLEDFREIRRAIKRTDKLVVKTLRKVECTHNPIRGDFHPHFHLVVEGKAVAERIIVRWLARRSDAGASAQDMRPCDEDGLMELFKYFTKLSVRLSLTDHRRIGPDALDVIFMAMRRRRVYQPVGFVLPKPDEVDEEAPIGRDDVTRAWSRCGERIVWEWSQSFEDWLDYSTGQMLTGISSPTIQSL